MGRVRKILFAIVTMAALVIIGIAASGPFLAVKRPYGRGTLVVEGWMPEASLRNALEVFGNGRYDHMVITGTVRPVSHHLRADEALMATLDAGGTTEIVVRVAGLPGVPWTLHRDHVLIKSGVATAEPIDVRANVSGSGLHTWRLGADSAAYLTAAGTDALFVGGWQVNGRSLHIVADSLWIADRTGASRPAARDHAGQAAQLLISMGMDPSDATILPAGQHYNGRTNAAAQRFAHYATAQQLDTCDVVTLGVHARRTWGAFRTACGPGVAVGILALDDPGCSAGRSIEFVRCWMLRAKEVIGLFASPVD